MGAHLPSNSLWILAVFLALSFSPSILENSKRGPSQVVYWNVGQGDFITFVDSSTCLIFDVGGSFRIPERDLLSLRETCFKRRADLFVSHFDKDHISNFRRLMTYIKIDNAYFSHLDTHTKISATLLETLRFQNSKITEIRQGFARAYPNGTSIRCLWPPRGLLPKSENDKSLVLELKVASRKLLFVGDLSDRVERKVPVNPIDILKVGHHGSRTSSSLKFLDRLEPKVCVVSVGRKNKFGHPTREALLRLTQSRCAILRTDTLGDVTIGL